MNDFLKQQHEELAQESFEPLYPVNINVNGQWMNKSATAETVQLITIKERNRRERIVQECKDKHPSWTWSDCIAFMQPEFRNIYYEVERYIRHRLKIAKEIQ